MGHLYVQTKPFLSFICHYFAQKFAQISLWLPAHHLKLTGERLCSPQEANVLSARGSPLYTLADTQMLKRPEGSPYLIPRFILQKTFFPFPSLFPLSSFIPASLRNSMSVGRAED